MPTTSALLADPVGATCQLTTVLDREWLILRYRPAAVAHARSWGVTTERFEDLDQLLHLAGHNGPRAPAANELMGRLVITARTDELASRVVLQRLLPGLLAIVRRRRRFSREEGFEELLGMAWLSIACYAVERRPERVVSNLVRDAAYRAFTAPSRLRSATETAIDPCSFDQEPASTAVSACDELAAVLVEARRAGVPDGELELLLHLVRAGSPTAVARERNVSTRTIRKYRERAAAQIRERCAPAA